MRTLMLVSVAVVTLLSPVSALALGQTPFVSFDANADGVPLVRGDQLAPLVVDPDDFAGVLRAARDLRADVERVTGRLPALVAGGEPTGDSIVIIGTLGRSRLLDGLAAAGKIDTTAIDGAWEAWLIETVTDPLPGVGSALVVAGSDKRGTIFGIYEISEQIGVSPWYWWADVPTKHHDSIVVAAGTRRSDRPAVRFRGIFINDEAPALTGWVAENYGLFNHEFYEHVFELILRLRGNFLWPAMWGRAFNDDDPLNPKIADEYGIVVSTSHHEPMQRAHVEWERYGEGPWDYARNPELLREFWTEGFNRTRQYENIVTLGMRGDGDEPMSEEENISLLETIVADQRAIIAANSDRPVTEVDQVWTLYKEVQGYYERGMRVPDDVTLLWSDDNWGNLRRLPTPAERQRSGGAGIYYHLDYVGGPRNYKWLNITPISKIREQLNLAWHYGARRIWVVNVGDIKPMEFPIEFFLTLAWAPERWPHERLADYGRLWAEREFGPEHAEEIAGLVSAYTRFNRRRSPELLSPETYSQVNYAEADTVVAEYNALADRAGALLEALPEASRDAFFQLVYWPVKASSIVNDLYVSAGKNRLYGYQGRAATNLQADRVRRLFAADAELTRTYNEELAGGKWNHFADQAHIGYTYWQQPPRQTMPPVTEVHLSEAAEMAVAVESMRNSFGSVNSASGSPVLPLIDVYGDQSRSIEVFNRGRQPFAFTATPGDPWLRVEPREGTVRLQTTLAVTVDWSSAPRGRHTSSVTVSDGQGLNVDVEVPVFFPVAPAVDEIDGFVEIDGHVSIEAEHFSRAVETRGVTWNVLDDFGRTLSGVTPYPVTADSQSAAGDSPRLEYDVYLFTPGEVSVTLITAPTLNFVPGRGLRLAVSFDDAPPQVVEIHANPANVQDWEETVANSVRQTTTRHLIDRPGRHALKVWMIDPGMVLEKIVVDLGGVRPSYLGPPETFNSVAR